MWCLIEISKLKHWTRKKDQHERNLLLRRELNLLLLLIDVCVNVNLFPHKDYVLRCWRHENIAQNRGIYIFSYFKKTGFMDQMGERVCMADITTSLNNWLVDSLIHCRIVNIRLINACVRLQHAFPTMPHTHTFTARSQTKNRIQPIAHTLTMTKHPDETMRMTESQSTSFDVMTSVKHVYFIHKHKWCQ